MSIYSRNPPPTSEASIIVLRQYYDLELRRIEAALRRPTVFGVEFEHLGNVPPKFTEGDLYYGLAGVFGGQAGLYVRDGSNWRKL